MTSQGGEEPKRTFVEQARRRQITTAAIEILAAHGYRGATFARIAAHAGISPSLISYHFSTKAELMGQVVSDILADLDTALEDQLAGASGHSAALRILIEAQVRYFAEHTTEVLALGHLDQADEETVSSSLGGHLHQALEEMETLFADGQAAGEFAEFPTRPMAVTLLAALNAVPGELFTNPRTDTSAYGKALADIFDAATRRGQPHGVTGHRTE